MIDFIPGKYFHDIYIYTCMFGILFTMLHAYAVDIHNKKNVLFINVFGGFLLVTIILLIGQRPITSRYGFGDTANYFNTFQYYSLGGEIEKAKDLGWHVFMKTISQIATAHTFFTICVFLYVFPLFKISKNLFGQYWFYTFVMFLVSFSFWTYGVNGVRNGIAGSIFLWGLCYRKNKVVMGLFFLWAILFHKTLILPITAFILTYFVNNPKLYLKGWLLCIPLSLAMGGFWISLFAGLGFDDDRVSGYLTSEGSGSRGFRWDFLFHSAFAVFAGWYFVIKRKFKDTFYYQLLNTYLICNAFWILVIKANFSNRFAYLSWFMMAIVITYPLLKQQFFKNQHIMIGKIVLLYFGFTYFMGVIYYGYLK